MVETSDKNVVLGIEMSLYAEGHSRNYFEWRSSEAHHEAMLSVVILARGQVGKQC